MCTCEFCHTEFVPRPQVKNARACNNDRCQKLRQAANEREWREVHTQLDSKEYHRIRRKQRIEKLKKVNSAFKKSFKIGVDFLGLPINIDAFLAIFESLLSPIGIRKINKVWTVDLINNFEQLDIDY